MSALRRGGQWVQVPAGPVYAWKQWLVFEGLFPLPMGNDGMGIDGEETARPPSPWDGGTRVLTQGTDDAFVTRVVLVLSKTGQRFEAPWDTMAPLPLGNGDVWLLWRCPQVVHDDGTRQDTLELITWAPRKGTTRRVGRLPSQSFGTYPLPRTHSLHGGMESPEGSRAAASAQAVVPVAGGALARIVTEAGDERWVRLDANGRVTGDSPDADQVRRSQEVADGGSPLAPLRRIDEAFVDLGGAEFLRTVDGRPVLGLVPVSQGPVNLRPSYAAGVALHDGFLFTDDGVFSWPQKTPRPVGGPGAW